MKIRFTIGLILLTFASFSQEIQWASKVLGFSSERTDPNTSSTEYRASQILGKPNKLPNTGECRCAWSPSSADTYAEEWIKVGFDKPMKISQVSIAENLNAGAIVRVSAFDGAGKEYLIKDITDAPPKAVGRMYNIIMPQTQFEVHAIKLLLIPSKLKGYEQIDAIGISESEKSYEPSINLAKSMPKEIVKESLGKGINTKYREVAPFITPDGKKLFFTREGHPTNISNATSKDKAQDVWVSNWVNNEWLEAENLKTPINTPEHNAVTAISPDGKMLYLLNIYHPDGSLEAGLSRSKKLAKGWEFPKPVRISDFSNKAKYTEFAIAPNQKVMVIACQRNDTYGKKDLYVSFLGRNEVWSKPINMGTTINTAEDESTPFIATDSKTLYFSTAGLPGYGNNDIFVTRRLDSSWTKWSEPENLGNQINTPKWDGYFTIPASGEYAYLSSEENSTGADSYEDIFRIKLFPSIKPEPVAIISGTVINALDKKPLKAEVILEVLGDSVKNSIMTADFDPETGEYKFVVPLKKLYVLNASVKGFISMSENIDLIKDRSFREIRRNISLIPVKEGQKIILHNLFFEQGKYELLSESYSELQRIIDLMKEFPTLEVLLEGHTHSTIEDDERLNVLLSDNRVKEVKKYLIEKGGIDEKRIQTKAWGGSRPISSNQTEETRKKNRRVEFTIIKL